MNRIAIASAVLLAPVVLLACDPGARGRAGDIVLAQAEPNEPGVTMPQPGTGLYDAGGYPTPSPPPGIAPRPTDPSVGPGETPRLPSNPGTDPGPGYPAPPGGTPGAVPTVP